MKPIQYAALWFLSVVWTAAFAQGQGPWLLRHAGSPSLNAVAFGGDQFVAVGNAGTLLTSPTGETWTARSVPDPATGALEAVAYGDGLWVAGSSTGGILRSPDGVTWSWNATGPSVRITALAHGNGVFVAIARQSLWASTNGLTWFSVAPDVLVTDRILAFGNGHFVAFHSFPSPRSLWISANGVVWTPAPAPSNENLYSVGFGDGRFLVIDTRNRAYLSPVLEFWTPGGTLVGLRPASLACGHGVFVAAGGGSPEFSVSGTAWTPAGAAGSSTIQGMAFGADTFVAVSFGGTIHQSGPWITAGMSTPGVVRVEGPGGGRYRIEARESFNTAAWTPVGEVDITTQAAEWVDSEAGNHPTRLYRVVGDW